MLNQSGDSSLTMSETPSPEASKREIALTQLAPILQADVMIWSFYRTLFRRHDYGPKGSASNGAIGDHVIDPDDATNRFPL